MSDSRESAKGLVSPQTLKGFQDLLPDEMIARNIVIDKIKSVYEKYGFVPVDTPILEYLVTLIGTGGEEINKELFRLDSPEREAIAMRFDLTVPFARLIAQYPEQLKLPLRRYHIGPVFRADDPKPGRYRQFTQLDIDAAGSESVAIDAEIIAAMCEVMAELGVQNKTEKDTNIQFQIRVNNRKLVDALLEGCKVDTLEQRKHVLRVVDKLKKVGVENIRKELGEGRIDDSGDPIRGVGLSEDVIDKILAFISITADTRAGIIESLSGLLPDSDSTRDAISEMNELADALDALCVEECDCVFDPSLARGLDYYTGPIYEMIIPPAPEIGSVMGGGRYDELVERFMDRSISATGISIGLDRLMPALRALGKFDTPHTTTRVLIVSIGKVPPPELLKVAAELRNAEIPTEVYFGKKKISLGKQLSAADAKQIDLAIIVGEDELKDDKISIKNLHAGKEKRSDIDDRDEYRKAGKTGQITIDRKKLVESISEMLAQIDQ